MRRTTDGTEFAGYSEDRKSTRLNSSHLGISYAVFCLKKKMLNTTKPVHCNYGNTASVGKEHVNSRRPGGEQYHGLLDVYPDHSLRQDCINGQRLDQIL